MSVCVCVYPVIQGSENMIGIRNTIFEHTITSIPSTDTLRVCESCGNRQTERSIFAANYDVRRRCFLFETSVASESKTIYSVATRVYFTCL